MGLQSKNMMSDFVPEVPKYTKSSPKPPNFAVCEPIVSLR